MAGRLIDGRNRPCMLLIFRAKNCVLVMSLLTELSSCQSACAGLLLCWAAGILQQPFFTGDYETKFSSCKMFCLAVVWLKLLVYHCSHYSLMHSVLLLFFRFLFWQLCFCPSVLWHCWLGVRKSIQPVKIKWWWDVGVVICLESGTDCLHMVQLMPVHPKTPSSLASFKFRLVLPFWYRLTQVVL